MALKAKTAREKIKNNATQMTAKKRRELRKAKPAGKSRSCVATRKTTQKADNGLPICRPSYSIEYLKPKASRKPDPWLNIQTTIPF